MIQKKLVVSSSMAASVRASVAASPASVGRKGCTEGWEMAEKEWVLSCFDRLRNDGLDLMGSASFFLQAYRHSAIWDSHSDRSGHNRREWESPGPAAACISEWWRLG